jgi:DNA-binding MarR family transcriptional regulator
MTRTAADEALLALARMVTGVSTRAADRLGTLSVVQLRALTVVHRLGPSNLGRLAHELAVTVSTASRLVDRLVAAGLVDRRPSPQSRREVALSLTEAGRDALERYDELRLQDLQACFAGVTDPDAALVAFREFAAGDLARAVPQPEDAGGDPACWLQRVCPACGRLADEDPPTVCPACGADLPAD